MTGKRSSSCGAMKLSTGRVVSEEKYIKKEMATIFRKYKLKRS